MTSADLRPGSSPDSIGSVFNQRQKRTLTENSLRIVDYQIPLVNPGEAFLQSFSNNRPRISNRPNLFHLSRSACLPGISSPNSSIQAFRKLLYVTPLTIHWGLSRRAARTSGMSQPFILDGILMWPSISQTSYPSPNGESSAARRILFTRCR